MAEKLKINVSFPQYDKHIYDFIKAQPNPSAFVRKLVEAYMNGTVGNVIMQQVVSNPNMNFGFNPVQNKMEEVAVTEENDKKNNDKKSNDIGIGEFSFEYKIDSEEELNKINDLPF